jgi:hypothetical protein
LAKRNRGSFDEHPAGALASSGFRHDQRANLAFRLLRRLAVRLARGFVHADRRSDEPGDDADRLLTVMLHGTRSDGDEPVALEHVNELAPTRLHAAAELGIEEGDRPVEVLIGVEAPDDQVGNCQIPRP